MPFSYFISWWINCGSGEFVWICAWVSICSSSSGLFRCPSHSLYILPRQQRCKTQNNKELESNRDREKDTAEKNHVKLCKAEMTQSSKWSSRMNLHFSVVFFSCHLDVWENGTKTNFMKQSHSSPQSVHLCLLSHCSPANQKHWSLSPWRQKAWWRHQTSFQNSRWKEFSSLLKLT